MILKKKKSLFPVETPSDSISLTHPTFREVLLCNVLSSRGKSRTIGLGLAELAFCSKWREQGGKSAGGVADKSLGAQMNLGSRNPNP